MSQFRVALVGCGRIAHRHAEVLTNGSIQDCCLVGVSDIVPSKSEFLGKKYRVPFYTDMNDMMASLSPDVVTVLTESGHHARHVIQLSAFGKVIVVEKPMALTVADAQEMIDSCQANSSHLFVVKQNRFNLPITKLREALIADRFGKLVLGTVRVRWCRKQDYYDQARWRGTWLMDGGVLTNQASHHLDMLLWMMGDVQEVFAFSSTAIADIEAEDTIVVNLRFKSGALGLIEATTATRPNDLEGSISVLGERGSVVVGGFAMNEISTWNFDQTLPGDSEVFRNFSCSPKDVYGFGHIEYYKHVASCLKGVESPIVDGFTGLKSVQLINAIYESIEKKKMIRIDDASFVSKLGH